MSKLLFVFTLGGCIHCDELKTYLNGNKFDYQEIDINEKDSIWNLVVDLTKQEYVPTIMIMDDHDINFGNIYVPIKDFNNINELIKIINENMKGD